MTKKTNEPSGWNPVFEFPLDDRNTIIIDGVKYKRVEEPKSPAEKAYYAVYGWYPPTTSSVSNYEDNRWRDFQNGYNASQEPEKQQKWDVVRESVKWCEEHPNESVEDWVKPQTPEQVADGLKEAFREAIKQGIIPEVNKPTDELIEKLVKNPPKFLKFELGENLTDLIYDWWEDVFTHHSEWDMETSIDDLVTRIDEWLPKEQSAAGSQNVDVEFLVEGFNDCINKIRRKLR
jgi:hypothetical protein